MLFILVPVGANAVEDHHHYYTILNVGHFLLAFLGLCGIAAVPAITKHVVDEPSEFVSFSKMIATIGFALMSINNFRQSGLDHDLAHDAVTHGDDVLDAVIIGWAGLVELSPDGWIDFGGVGLWILSISYVALRNKTQTSKMNYLGFVSGTCLVITVIGNALSFQPLVVLGVGIGGLTVIPLWFILQGVKLQKVNKQSNVIDVTA
ncbi:hypothetical protein CVD19_02760 [Bacillus sp. T33-2]|nr:hypothetical protein CVD19_02760 [Bacillus sp. T33-2]